MIDAETFYTIPEAAEKLRVKRDVVYKWMRQGRIEYVIVGSARRITGSALTAFILSGKETKRGPRGGTIADTRTPMPATA